MAAHAARTRYSARLRRRPDRPHRGHRLQLEVADIARQFELEPCSFSSPTPESERHSTKDDSHPPPTRPSGRWLARADAILHLTL
jgi:hypothetical protein